MRAGVESSQSAINEASRLTASRATERGSCGRADGLAE